jgi:hypothetical protein
MLLPKKIINMPMLENSMIKRIIFFTFLILIRACPLAMLGVGARFQVRGHKPWGRKAAKRAYKLAFLPPRPQRLPPLRAFHLSASRSQLARTKPFKFKIENGKGKNEN